MTTLAEIIKKRKAKEPISLYDMQSLVTEYVKDVLDARLPAIEREVEQKRQSLLEEFKVELDSYLARNLHNFKGPKGDTVVGPSGPKGDTVVGPPGKPGIAGKDSTIPGPPGQPGSPGMPGKDGSPDTPQDIAKKVNTLTEAIDLTVLKGWKRWSDNIQKALKERGGGKPSGGGMGNIQHEVTVVTSATTTVSTTYTVGGSGYALWLYYNGQGLTRGTHYTVSGKTITLLFTPDDPIPGQNNTILAVYIRT